MANTKKTENKPKAPQGKTKRKSAEAPATAGKKRNPKNSDGKKKTAQKQQSRSKSYQR